MSLRGNVTCPCCGYKTLQSEREWDICSICFWEDDPYQRDEIHETGANPISLVEAQMNYQKIGACERTMLKNVRKTNSVDKKGDDWINYIPHSRKSSS